jgi:cob(I)alamin adenosyltransferase
MKSKRIYTKTGDTGKTALLGGKRVAKCHDRIEAYGNVDELNSNIGYLRVLIKSKKDKDSLLYIQHCLMNIQTQLAAADEKIAAKFPALKSESIRSLEKEIDTISEKLPPLKSFLIPGGNQAAAWCHIVRCNCRRAERLVVKFAERNKVDPLIIPYLNRLSDYLFVLARELSSE